jgi:N-acetylglucosamine kinase
VGETARAGGWGYIFGDEGGAFDLVRQALRAALRHEEGWGAPTRLRDSLLEATGASDVNNLMHRFYTSEYPRDRIASYAKLIDDDAAAGDAVARDLLLAAAQALAMLVAAVKHRLFAGSGGTRVSYTGGVFESTLLRARFHCLAELDGSSVQPPEHGPAAGALMEALRIAGIFVRPRGGPKGV